MSIFIVGEANLLVILYLYIYFGFLFVCFYDFTKSGLIFSLLVLLPLSVSPTSASGAPQVLHPAHEPRDHARRQRQHHLRGGGLTHALRQVDAGSRRPDPRGRDACWAERSGAEQHPGVRQLHMCCHVQSGHH